MCVCVLGVVVECRCVWVKVDESVRASFRTSIECLTLTECGPSLVTTAAASAFHRNIVRLRGVGATDLTDLVSMRESMFVVQVRCW